MRVKKLDERRYHTSSFASLFFPLLFIIYDYPNHPKVLWTVFLGSEALLDVFLFLSLHYWLYGLLHGETQIQLFYAKSTAAFEMSCGDAVGMEVSVSNVWLVVLFGLLIESKERIHSRIFNPFFLMIMPMALVLVTFSVQCLVSVFDERNDEDESLFVWQEYILFVHFTTLVSPSTPLLKPGHKIDVY